MLFCLSVCLSVEQTVLSYVSFDSISIFLRACMFVLCAWVCCQPILSYLLYNMSNQINIILSPEVEGYARFDYSAVSHFRYKYKK